ncbi:hypothetical protein PROFUN_16357 [Planoprotostelium fungivorum]|uniref:Uncharacterized protein n=1 Tax=Planoprotostelium fungivorum TaxID=1890364 RepID=A0A2P6MR63_9EUKA|nr:hypothetical protein PROFUN_16357 [Planoprotostelium fungivorum]
MFLYSEDDKTYLLVDEPFFLYRSSLHLALSLAITTPTSSTMPIHKTSSFFSSFFSGALVEGTTDDEMLVVDASTNICMGADSGRRGGETGILDVLGCRESERNEIRLTPLTSWSTGTSTKGL